MKTCAECKGKMVERKKKMPEGIEYSYHHCTTCGDEILDMDQLHNVAEQYRMLKRYQVTLSQWGMSVGLRIPKDLADHYNFTPKSRVVLIPEKKGILILN